MQKAGVALSSARLLLDADDVEGCLNRSYFAAYDAARAAMLALDDVNGATHAKTHSALIASFGLRLVKPGMMTVAAGRILNRLHELRMVADYREIYIDVPTARQALVDAESFVSEVTAWLGRSLQP